MPTKIAPADAEAGDTEAAAAMAAARSERRRVCKAMRSLVLETLQIGLTTEQCFRHFSEGGADVTEQRLHAKLAEMDVQTTHAVVRALIGQYTEGGSVLDRGSFERMVGIHDDTQVKEKPVAPKRGGSGTLHRPASLRRSMLPTSLSSQHSSRSELMLDPLGEHTKHAAGLPKFRLEMGQVVIQDDPEFVERFVPIQVGELVDRLLYECRHETIFADKFQELSALLRKLVYVRMHDKSSEAFRLYMHHDPDDDQQRIMRAAFSYSGGGGAGFADFDGDDGAAAALQKTRRLGHSLNLRLFQHLMQDFCEHANFTQVPDDEMQNAVNMATGLDLEWERDFVELKAFERGRRFVDVRFPREVGNLWGLWLPGSWRFIPWRRVCTKRKRLFYEDEWRCGLIPWHAAGGPNTWYYTDHTHKERVCCCCSWKVLVQRTRVFSRLMVAWRVSQPGGLSDHARHEVVQLAATQLAKAGVGKQHGAPDSAAGDRDGATAAAAAAAAAAAGAGDSETDPALAQSSSSSSAGKSKASSFSDSFIDNLSERVISPWRGGTVSPEERAQAHSSKFVFLKLFKDYPVDDIELVRPFVTPKLSRFDKFTILIVVTVGTVISIIEGVDVIRIWWNDVQEASCQTPPPTPLAATQATTEAACLEAGGVWVVTRPDLPVEQFLASVLGFGGYYVRAYFNWLNKMTAFREKLLSNLFFRVIDNNRGALAAMLYEAEMQEQREALLLFFFLHFRWLGPDDNRFVMRKPGAALQRGQVDREIETWLTEVTSINVDFDLDDAVADLTRLGIVEQLTSSQEAAAALKIESYAPVETARARSQQSMDWEGGVMRRTQSRSAKLSTNSRGDNHTRRALATGFGSQTRLAAHERKVVGVKCELGQCAKWRPPLDLAAEGEGGDAAMEVEVDLLDVLDGLSQHFQAPGDGDDANDDDEQEANADAGVEQGEANAGPADGGVQQDADGPVILPGQPLPGSPDEPPTTAAAAAAAAAGTGAEAAPGPTTSDRGAVPGLYHYHPCEKGGGIRFVFELLDEGVPYNADEKVRLSASTAFDIPAAARHAVTQRLRTVSLATGTLRRTGISFLAAVRARWHPRNGDVSTGADEREVLLFGVNSYDPAGRSGDTHASEAVGGNCQTVLIAAGAAFATAAVLGASAAQLRQMHAACVPLITQLHGRLDALDWVLRQVIEAMVLPSGSGNPSCKVTPYPIHLLQVRGGTADAWGEDEHAHTRQYLRVFEDQAVFKPTKAPRPSVYTSWTVDGRTPAVAERAARTQWAVRGRAAGEDGDASVLETVFAVLPRQFFKKLKVKGESEVLRPVMIEQAIVQLRDRWGEGDTALRYGDRVRVTKLGRQMGRIGMVLDPYWSGRIKLVLEPRPSWGGWANPARTAALRQQQRHLLLRQKRDTAEEVSTQKAVAGGGMKLDIKSYLKHELELVERGKES